MWDGSAEEVRCVLELPQLPAAGDLSRCQGGLKTLNSFDPEGILPAGSERASYRAARLQEPSGEGQWSNKKAVLWEALG